MEVCCAKDFERKMEEGGLMARPRKQIDQKSFESLCALQCTLEEVCGFFDVTDKTLDGWCKRTYGSSFSEVFKQKRGSGKISLRRAQFRLAEKNASMAIWLGKQYLGQKDDPQMVFAENVKIDGLSKSLQEMEDALNSDDVGE